MRWTETELPWQSSKSNLRHPAALACITPAILNSTQEFIYQRATTSIERVSVYERENLGCLLTHLHDFIVPKGKVSVTAQHTTTQEQPTPTHTHFTTTHWHQESTVFMYKLCPSINYEGMFVWNYSSTQRQRLDVCVVYKREYWIKTVHSNYWAIFWTAALVVCVPERWTWTPQRGRRLDVIFQRTQWF